MIYNGVLQERDNMEILNRKAHHDYFIDDVYEAGIVLTGTEIKSIRNGNCNIKDCYAIIKNGEVFLLNMYVGQYKEGNIFNHSETRSRKLLLHKKPKNVTSSAQHVIAIRPGTKKSSGKFGERNTIPLITTSLPS